jgi:large subunit ribosomal protein L29
MQAKEIRDMSAEEMNEKLLDLKKELFALRFQHTVHQLDNTARLKTVKRDIARIKTVLRADEIKKLSAAS